jgi:hypothetical protein
MQYRQNEKHEIIELIEQSGLGVISGKNGKSDHLLSVQSEQLNSVESEHPFRSKLTT